jgi:DNA-binding response OmpR family regulator
VIKSLSEKKTLAPILFLTAMNTVQETIEGIKVEPMIYQETI